MSVLISRAVVLLWFTLVMLASCQQKPMGTESTGPMGKESMAYDSAKAIAYGADEYGMKKYVMAFLKKGPNQSESPEQAAELQKAHLENIRRMAEEGTLVLAGPFFGDGEIRGIYVFDVPTIAEAEALTQTDPSIQAGVLAMDHMEWYGSAALMEVNSIHQTLARKSVVDE